MARIGKTTSIRKWYQKAHGDDVLSDDVNDVSFATLYDCLKNHIDAYAVIGIGDSVIRERIFGQLAKVYKVDYSVIYNMWV